MGSLGIAIDGGRYVRVDSSIGDLSRRVILRTLSADQKTAKLEFCSFRKKGPVIRKTVIVEGLETGGESPAEIRLNLYRHSFALWIVEIRKPGGNIREVRVRTGIGIRPLFILGALLLITVLWMLISVVGSYSRHQGLPATVETTAVADSPLPVEQSEAEARFVVKPSESPLPAQETAQETTTGPSSETDKAPVPTVPNSSANPVHPSIPPLTTVYFQPESAVLSADARKTLDGFASLLIGDISVEVGGHCADYGTERGRILLSRKRAEAAAGFLEERIPETVELKIHAYGSSRPLSRNPDLQDMNRRVELIIEGVDE